MPFRSFCRSARRLFPIALAALVATAASAQTAPQLLPYTVNVVAGGGPVATFTAGSACPTSGFVSTDTYGDGCPATDLTLKSGTSAPAYGPLYAIADKTGAIFFSDGANGLVRRIDPATNVVTIVAGGKTSSPQAASACGTNISTDARGDGCLANAVHLTHPNGLVFAANGDLYFADSGQYDVRRVAADPATGLIATTGVISNVAGYAGGSATYGYTVSNASTPIIAATQSYLDGPFGLAFDKQGDLFISDEFKNAVLVVNTNSTGSTLVNGVSVPAGTITKIAGAFGTSATTAPNPVCPNGNSVTGGTYGCSFNPFVEGAPANNTWLDSPFGVTVDPNGVVYIANEFNNVVPKVSTSGLLNTFAGNQTTYGTNLTRGPAGSFAIGSDFGIASDASSNVYITDALNGVVWRVDADTKSMYVVAGGGKPCSTVVDAYGDGCIATQATFGSTLNTTKTGAKYATSAAPGIFGVTVDQYADLFVGDTSTDLIREISAGTQFGAVGLNGKTQNVAIHFASGDSPGANPYVITAGAANFAIGTPSCNSMNSDGTTDCIVPVTATPTLGALGSFSGTLQVAATVGGTASFPLNAISVNTPATKTTVSAVANTTSTCTGTIYSTQTPFTLTAKVVSSGTPVGTVTFFDNGTQIGDPQALSAAGTATLTYTFATAGTHQVTATYSGDTFFVTSTGTAPTFTTATPGFGIAADPTVSTKAAVTQGGTANFGFTLAQNVYSGTITFACSGLPAKSTCVFSPATITATGCSTSSTVAVSIVTTQGTPAGQAGFVTAGNRWAMLFALVSVLGLTGFGIRRRGTASRLGQLALIFAALLAASSLVACGNGTKTVAGTPLGTSTVTVTATGSTGGIVGSVPVTLTVQ